MWISPRFWARVAAAVGLPLITRREAAPRATAIFRPRSSGVVNVSQMKLARSQALKSSRAWTPVATSATRAGSANGGIGEKILLLLLGPGDVVRHDPDQHFPAGRFGRLHFPPGDAASPFVRNEAVAVGDDAHHHVALPGLALTLGHRL